MPINPMSIKPKVRLSTTVIPEQDESLEKIAALDAVQRYESLRHQVEAAKTSFAQQFPEAVSALQDIRRIEDELNEAISDAKPKVAMAKETVGEFICKRRFSTAHYDSKKVTEVIGSFDNAGEVFVDLYKSGVVKTIEFDKDALTSCFARDPGYSKAFKSAWKEKTELTPAVTVPKV